MRCIAVLVTVFNRREKTRACLQSLLMDFAGHDGLSMDMWITDDGSTDGTSEMLRDEFPQANVLEGDGNLFWNGGMINSWKAAMAHGGYDSYLLLNNDVEILPGLFDELVAAEEHSLKTYGKRGIYVGSTQNPEKTAFTYGGFNFRGKLTLKDEYVLPNGDFQTCQCAHGNVTCVSSDVVDSMGIFHDGYFHGGTDHDYTYLAWKAGFPLVVLRDYVGLCENDHCGSDEGFKGKNLKERIAYLESPRGQNLHNILLFQKRCFPMRLPFAFVAAWCKALFPGISYRFYRLLRK